VQLRADHPESEMHDVLKQLNDRNPSDLKSLDEGALRRLETLCENWAKIAEAELARRKSLPMTLIVRPLDVNRTPEY
jgi:hypothetical protein